MDFNKSYEERRVLELVALLEGVPVCASPASLAFPCLFRLAFVCVFAKLICRADSGREMAKVVEVSRGARFNLRFKNVLVRCIMLLLL